MSDAPFVEDRVNTSFLGFFERIGGCCCSLTTCIFLGIMRMPRLWSWTDGNRAAFWDGFFSDPDFGSSLASAEASSLTAREKSSSTVFRLWSSAAPNSRSPGVLLLDCEAWLTINA